METNHYLVSCLTYIDLNRVRTGAHPSQWEFGGYAEIHVSREKYSIIDHRALTDLLGVSSIEARLTSHSAWVEEALARAGQLREGKWTEESVAVGSRDFVEAIKGKLRIRAKGRGISRMDG